jgi:phenylalanyl-tRNA synthetase beta subunit
MRIPLEWLKEYIKIDKSPKEIAESFTALGLMLEKIEDDVLSLEHRMDRSDWLSIIGCARDVAAFEGIELKYPELYTEKPKTPEKPYVDIKVECPDKVHRFNTRVFKNIKVGESPDWLKTRLEAYGIPAINNIVDITNYVMVELGQPMHAQDISRMEKPEIVIRNARKGEEVITFHGDKVALDESMFVLTQNDKPTVIGGVVGGQDTGVIEKTTDIVLDAGNYDQNNIRKTSRKIKIQNESVLRHDKFLHPGLTELAIQRATKLILDLAGGEYYENIDWYPEKAPPKQMTLRIKRLEDMSGMKADKNAAKRILTALEYKILEESDDNVKVEVPYFRTDVEVEDDLVADVLRIGDYRNIPISLIDAAPPKEVTPEIYKFEEKLRDICVNLGLHEHITDPVVKKSGEEGEVVLENALSSEKNALRMHVEQTLRPVVATYKKQKIGEVGIFEIGKVYSVSGEGTDFEDFKEERFLEIIYKDSDLTPRENANEVKKLLASVLEDVGASWDKLEKFGKISPDSVSVNTEKLMKLYNPAGPASRVVSEIENYTVEDMSFVLEEREKFGEAYAAIKEMDDKIVDVKVVEERPADNGKKSVLVRISYNTSDTEKIREKIVSELEGKFKLKLRD